MSGSGLASDHGQGATTRWAPAFSCCGASTHTLVDTGGVLPGALEALRKLHDRPDVVSTVLTAEARAAALAKLQAGDLDQYLRTECGVFGDDAPDEAGANHAAADHAAPGRAAVPEATLREAALVEVAWRRNAMAFGPRNATAFGPQNTVMIGATPDTVAAAQRHGVFVVGVATGQYTQGQLRDAGANAVLPDLTVFPRVQALIDRGQPA